MRSLLAFLIALCVSWSSTSSAHAGRLELQLGETLTHRAHAKGYGAKDSSGPTTGRFLSLDPVQGTLDQPLSTQGFTYAYGMPTRFTDPDGRCPQCVLAVALVAVAFSTGNDETISNPLAPLTGTAGRGAAALKWAASTKVGKVLGLALLGASQKTDHGLNPETGDLAEHSDVTVALPTLPALFVSAARTADAIHGGQQRKADIDGEISALASGDFTAEANADIRSLEEERAEILSHQRGEVLKGAVELALHKTIGGRGKAKLTKRRDGGLRFRKGDTRSHGIEADLDASGTLAVEIRASPMGANRDRFGSGSEMFDEMMAAVGPENVKRFRASWSEERGLGTNYDQYQLNMAESRWPTHDAQLEAAANTWTGRRLKSYGFRPEIVQDRGKKVEVIFERTE